MGRHVASTIERAFMVLESFDGPAPELSLADVARATGLARASAHRLLRALGHARCVVQDARSRRYRIGPRVFEFGMIYQRQLDVRRQALPHMHALRDACGETVVLSTLHEGAVVIVDQVITHFELKFAQDPGRRYPPTQGATGRVLAAFLPEPEQQRMARAAGAFVTARDRQRFLEQLADVRRDGIAVSASERVVGALSLSGPVWGIGEVPLAAISVTGPLARFGAELLARTVPALKRVLDDVSTELGGGPRSRQYPMSRVHRGGEVYARLAAELRQMTGGRPGRERAPS